MIVLIGFMGAGKSTIGAKLATGLGLPFIDTDRVLEDEFGTSVSQFFEDHGEGEFRRREAAVVLRSLKGPDSVIALGGGSVLDPAVAAELEWSRVVYLRAGFAEIRRRLKSDMSRPLLGHGDLLGLYQERCSLYERMAHISFDTENFNPDELVRTIAAWAAPPHGAPSASSARPVAPPPPPPRTVSVTAGAIRVDLGARSYDITVRSGSLEEAAEVYPAPALCETVVVIADAAVTAYSKLVANSYAGSGKKVRLFELPVTESSKTLAQAGALSESLADVPAHRNDLIVTVGGGVVSDLGGFVASLYARGMDVVHCPTTLLGQVDAAIGGKTAVNLPSGKNLVGTIHQPRAVICDVDALRTLPDEELRSGMAEVLKYGFISDPGLLEFCVSNVERILGRETKVLEEIVGRSAEIKARVVSADETERGPRAHLNYGHTFAHALEHRAGYEGLRHGEAVALGMMAAAFVSAGMGWIDDSVVAAHERALDAFDLPKRRPMHLLELEDAWQRDKKYQGGTRFVLLEELGKPKAGVAVDREVLGDALERMSG